MDARSGRPYPSSSLSPSLSSSVATPSSSGTLLEQQHQQHQRRAASASEVDSMEIEQDVDDFDFGASDLASRGGRLMAELMATAGELFLGDDVVFTAAEPDMTEGGGGGASPGGFAHGGPHGGGHGIVARAHISIPGATAGDGGEGQLPLVRRAGHGTSWHVRRTKSRGEAEGNAPPQRPQLRPQLVSLVGTARAFEGFIPRLRGVRTLLGGSDDEEDEDDENEYEGGGEGREEHGRGEEEAGARGEGREGQGADLPQDEESPPLTTPPRAPPPSSSSSPPEVAEPALDRAGTKEEDST